MPNSGNVQESADEDDTNTTSSGNLEIGKALQAYVKVCKLQTNKQDAVLKNIITEEPKRRR